MKKDSVIQFVGFVTNLEFTEFVPQWENFTRQFMKLPGARIAQRQGEGRNNFKYVSMHELPEGGFQFNFMKGRNSEHFPEQRVKVVQAGGYMAIQLDHASSESKGTVKVMSFISHDETDIDFYRNLTGYRFLNIYQAYYENCTFGYILEFITTPAQSLSLAEQLKDRPGCDTVIYKDVVAPAVKSRVTSLHTRGAH